jgi:hypothetical protein
MYVCVHYDIVQNYKNELLGSESNIDNTSHGLKKKKK